MVTTKDLTILSHLRNNARKKVTEIAQEMDIPLTTIYDRIRAHKKKGFVKKHVALLDFAKLGYPTSAVVAFSVDRDQRDALYEYLQNHTNTNTLYRVDFGHDFLAEMVFENQARLHEFVDFTQQQFKADTRIFTVINEIKKEAFLS